MLKRMEPCMLASKLRIGTARMSPSSDGERQDRHLSRAFRVSGCRGPSALISWSIHSRCSRPPSPWWLHGSFARYVTGTGVYWVIGFFVISGYCI